MTAEVKACVTVIKVTSTLLQESNYNTKLYLTLKAILKKKLFLTIQCLNKII